MLRHAVLAEQDGPLRFQHDVANAVPLQAQPHHTAQNVPVSGRTLVGPAELQRIHGKLGNFILRGKAGDHPLCVRIAAVQHCEDLRLFSGC